jgi:hypothetical protein
VVSKKAGAKSIARGFFTGYWLLVTVPPAHAQQPRKAFHIGYLAGFRAFQDLVRVNSRAPIE